MDAGVGLPYALVDGLLLHHAALAGHELGFYRELAEGDAEVEALAQRLGLAPRVVEMVAGAAGRFGLVVRREGRLALTEQGRAGTLGPPSRLLGFGAHLFRHAYHYDRLLAVLRSDGPPALPFGEGWFGGGFAEAMHEHALPVARHWPGLLDLARHRHLLDVGGGSGTHAAAALRAAPGLRASVLELPAMAPGARAAAQAAGLQDRLAVVEGDMWSGTWPAADLHLLADVLHDWRAEAAARLVQRSFDALPAGGRLALLEMPLLDDGGPPEVLASSLAMLLLTGGQQYSLAELGRFLEQAGFVGVRARRVIGPWYLIDGTRP